MFSFKTKIPLLLVFFILNVISASLLAIEISASVDHNPVNLNESVQITFSANDEPDREPDFSPLEKDFTILEQAQQQSTQIINWERKKSYQWVLTVMAKRTGKLVIPAINFGQDSSQFSSLTVNEAQVTGKENEDLFLQVKVDNRQPYIQQQIIYTLKLYSKVRITQANLTEPASQNTIIEKLGEDKSFNALFQGEKYKVIERKYAIFPQKSGSMSIAPLTMTANVVTANQRQRNSFFNRQSTRTIRVVSEAISLEVQAKPTNVASEGWLPATQVYLQDKWSDASLQMTVGEPNTRTITLLVEGASAGGLPELYKKGLSAQLKAYPDQPVLKEEARDTGVVSLREEKIALIPGEAGEYILPAIEVPWWNTQTQKMEVARIAERTITAVVSASSNQQVIQPPEADVPSLGTPLVNSEAKSSSILQNKPLLWLALFFASGWGATLIYFLSKKTEATKQDKASAITKKMLVADKKLRLACTENNSVMAKDALLEWGREQFGYSSLSKIAEQCNTDLQDEILALNRLLYSNNTGAWKGNPLWVSFQNHKPAIKEKSEALNPLPPLFKI